MCSMTVVTPRASQSDCARVGTAVVALPLGHEERHHPIRTEGANREREADRGIDTPADPQHQSAPAQGAHRLARQRLLDAGGDGVDVEPHHLTAELLGHRRSAPGRSGSRSSNT